MGQVGNADGGDVTPTVVPVDTAAIADVLGLVSTPSNSGA